MASFTAPGEVFIRTETAEILRFSADDTETSTDLEATRPEKKSIRNPMNNATANDDAEQSYQFPTIIVQSEHETLATSSSNSESKEARKLYTGEMNEGNSLDGAIQLPSSSDQAPGSCAQGLIEEKINTDSGVKREGYSSAKPHSANSLVHEGAMPPKSDVSQQLSDGEMQNRNGRDRKRLPPLTVSTLTTSSASEFRESTDQPEKGDGQLRKSPELSLKFGSNLSLRTLGKCYP